MTDPERLLNGAGSDFERELLGSLVNEQPSRSLSRRMRQGLVALGVLTSAKAGVAAVVALVGLLSLGVGSAWLVQHGAVAPVTPAVSAPVRAVPAPALPASAAPAPPEAVLAEPAPVVAPRPTAAPTPSGGGDLREQIAWLDRAREAVRGGDSHAALSELAQYRVKFPRGEFAQEVTVLKIEALVQDGQMAAARSLGKKFFTSHPESPHVERIERLIGTAR
jgi:hypothetical protein